MDKKYYALRMGKWVMIRSHNSSPRKMVTSIKIGKRKFYQTIYRDGKCEGVISVMKFIMRSGLSLGTKGIVRVPNSMVDKLLEGSV